MSDDLINQLLTAFGASIAAAGATGVLGHPWSELLSAIGGAITGQAALRRRGDIAISELPKDVQDSVRPPKG
jgi:hypothetical protein